MFNTITRKTKEAKAYAGAATAVIKALHQERKEITYLIACYYPELTKKEQKQRVRELLVFKINAGLIHT